MVAPSKLYEWPVNQVHCSHILSHVGQTCFQASLWNIYRFTVSSSKYFAPLLITPFFFHDIKSLNAKMFRDNLKHYLQSVMCCSGLTTAVFSCICLQRNLIGRFTKYFILSGFAGTQAVWLFPDRVLRFFLTGTSQVTLEALLRYSSNPLARLIVGSKLIQTLWFMLNSAIILHATRAKQYTGFWFIKPHTSSSTHGESASENGTVKSEVPSRSNPSGCEHPGSTCRTFVLEGMKTYFRYGATLDIISMILKRKIPKTTKGVVSIGLHVLKGLRFNMTGFFLSYVGIYRVSSCLLAKYFNTNSASTNHLIAAFLGGASYMCLSRVSFYTLSLVIAIQILWKKFCHMPKSTSNTYSPFDMLKKVPFGRIILSVNLTVILYFFIFHNHVVNSLGTGFFNAASDFKTQELVNFFKNNDLVSLGFMASQAV